MATLVVIGHESELEAQEVRLALRKLEREHLLDLVAAVVVVGDAHGRIRLRQLHNRRLHNLTARGVRSGRCWDALTDVGLSNDFITQLAQTLTPGSAALWVLVRRGTVDRVLEEIKGFDGTVLKTSLSDESEAKLQAVLSGGGSRPPRRAPRPARSSKRRSPLRVLWLQVPPSGTSPTAA